VLGRLGDFSCGGSKSMPKDSKKLGIFAEPGRLIVLAMAVGLMLGMAGPSSAQFFNFGGYQQRQQPQRGGGWFGNEQRGGGWFGNDPFAPNPQQYAPRHGRQAPPAVREDFSKAPSPDTRNTVPERHILVLGDAHGGLARLWLEDVFADQPEMGVIRKHKTVSGLINYQPKGNPADWAAAAKGILATEKADPLSSCSDLKIASQSASRRPTNPTPSRGTRRTPQPNLMASLRRKTRGYCGWGSHTAAGSSIYSQSVLEMGFADAQCFTFSTSSTSRWIYTFENNLSVDLSSRLSPPTELR
jgi:hypothetical protein